MGALRSSELAGEDRRMRFSAPPELLAGAREGDSMCVSGVCLTMLEPDAEGFSADLSKETLSFTTLGRVAAGGSVNLEPALRAADRLGGHLVSGHVDGRATLLSRRPDGRSERFLFELPAELARYVARKGSICIDGVSLTVNGVDGARFDVCIIPHTLEVTTLGDLAPGDEVNIEVDMVARYIERLLEPSEDSSHG
ncbi:MAG: riboflavin synthase [Gammaproteobacteria bacterium]